MKCCNYSPIEAWVGRGKKTYPSLLLCYSVRSSWYKFLLPPVNLCLFEKFKIYHSSIDSTDCHLHNVHRGFCRERFFVTSGGCRIWYELHEKDFLMAGSERFCNSTAVCFVLNRVKQAIAKKEETLKTLRDQHQVM